MAIVIIRSLVFLRTLDFEEVFPEHDRAFLRRFYCIKRKSEQKLYLINNRRFDCFIY